MEWKKEERIEKRKLITIICLLFNSLRNLNQCDHLAKGASLGTPGTLCPVWSPHSPQAVLYIFFSLLSFNTIESYSVPGLGT